MTPEPTACVHVKTEPSPVKSSPEKVAAKLFILQGSVGATFFRSCLGGAQSIAYRNVGMRGVSRISRAEIRVARYHAGRSLDEVVAIPSELPPARAHLLPADRIG